MSAFIVLEFCLMSYGHVDTNISRFQFISNDFHLYQTFDLLLPRPSRACVKKRRKKRTGILVALFVQSRSGN